MCCNPENNRETRSEQKPFLRISWGVLGTLLIAGASYGYWNHLQTANAKTALFNYLPQEVAREKPLRAEHIHGMAGQAGGMIPFLPQDRPQPRILVSQTLYNFGSIKPQDIVKQTFVIRNTGAGPLTISNAYTTCGCTTADFSSSVIPPGKVALVTVTFDAGFHDTRGQTVKRGVIIENNDPNRPKVEIWLQAHVQKK